MPGTITNKEDPHTAENGPDADLNCAKTKKKKKGRDEQKDNDRSRLTLFIVIQVHRVSCQTSSRRRLSRNRRRRKSSSRNGRSCNRLLVSCTAFTVAVTVHGLGASSINLNRNPSLATATLVKATSPTKLTGDSFALPLGMGPPLSFQEEFIGQLAGWPGSLQVLEPFNVLAVVTGHL